jgi:hypothetical protein
MLNSSFDNEIMHNFKTLSATKFLLLHKDLKSIPKKLAGISYDFYVDKYDNNKDIGYDGLMDKFRQVISAVNEPNGTEFQNNLRQRLFNRLLEIVKNNEKKFVHFNVDIKHGISPEVSRAMTVRDRTKVRKFDRKLSEVASFLCIGNVLDYYKNELDGPDNDKVNLKTLLSDDELFNSFIGSLRKIEMANYWEGILYERLIKKLENFREENIIIEDDMRR